MDTLYYSATVFATCSSDHNNKTDWKCINMCLPFVGNATTVFANGANNRCIYLGCPKGVLDFNEGKNAYTINELSLAFPYIYSSSAKPLQLFYMYYLKTESECFIIVYRREPKASGYIQ